MTRKPIPTIDNIEGIPSFNELMRRQNELEEKLGKVIFSVDPATGTDHGAIVGGRVIKSSGSFEIDFIYPLEPSPQMGEKPPMKDITPERSKDEENETQARQSEEEEESL